jgi:hypothetical protein
LATVLQLPIGVVGQWNNGTVGVGPVDHLFRGVVGVLDRPRTGYAAAVLSELVAVLVIAVVDVLRR